MNPCGTLRIPRIFKRRQRPRRIPRTRRRWHGKWISRCVIPKPSDESEGLIWNDWLIEIPGSSKKKQPSTGNHRDTLLTPASPNFNVVIGSAQLFFLKAAKHKIQKTTLNWGTGGHDLCGVVQYFMGWLFFLKNSVCSVGIDKCWDGFTRLFKQSRLKSHIPCVLPLIEYYPLWVLHSSQCAIIRIRACLQINVFKFKLLKMTPYSNSYLQPFSPQTSLPLGPSSSGRCRLCWRSRRRRSRSQMQSRRKPRCGEDYTSTMAVLIGRIGFITIGFSEPIFGQSHILGGEVVYHELATKIQFASICLPFCLRINTPNGNFYRHGLKLKA